MFPNRMESYRHSFGKPPEIRMEILREDGVQYRVFGLMLDVSTGGAKLFSEHELMKESEIITFFFIVNYEKITTCGKLVWKLKKPNGWVYGVKWFADPVKELLIAEEIKAGIAIS
ncbi:PilZ domain-containing protein [Planococcus liqunii]|uniref:PilZ domain-containing protein n=1 Tax=Planococcus liqunii TaxID=3058394 RepID=A0ABT8MMX1_9BACL|nr:MULTISPECIES: PilZ domain-containing protein [unclassified Planococcus (in: firmicutes)]MDN7226215.1 PilZ domain-containing protein [Planococcus sp. N064]WKA49994.1 PilZ domain-containing protein [Planococcus sp. N056]